jgi:fumarate hydratase class I
MRMQELPHPFTAEGVSGLRAGDRVKVSGVLYTARCRVHKALLDGLACPVPLANAAIYQCSPIMTRQANGWVLRAAGPSASIAVGAYMAEFIGRFGVRVVIGMGSQGEETRRACARAGCVYLQTVGGGAGRLADSIHAIRGVHFMKEFGAADAMWELEADKLEAVVAIDARGRSLHRRVQSASRRVLQELMAR